MYEFYSGVIILLWVHSYSVYTQRMERKRRTIQLVKVAEFNTGDQ
jgi:hypothetical protein